MLAERVISLVEQFSSTNDRHFFFNSFASTDRTKNMTDVWQLWLPEVALSEISLSFFQVNIELIASHLI